MGGCLGKYTSFFDQRLSDIGDHKARLGLFKRGSGLRQSRLICTLEARALGDDAAIGAQQHGHHGCSFGVVIFHQ
jgi:hypothetical protein